MLGLFTKMAPMKSFFGQPVKLCDNTTNHLDKGLVRWAFVFLNLLPAGLC